MLKNRRVVLGSAAALAAGAKLAEAATLKPGAAGDQTAALQEMIDSNTELALPAGKFRVSGLTISKPLKLTGVPGRTLLVSDMGPVLTVRGAKHVTLHGISFDAAGEGAVVGISDCEAISIENCRFLGSARIGLSLRAVSGRVTGCEAGFLTSTGILALDSRGLEISGCHVHDIGNNGIQVWTTEQREDGTLVIGNRVERVAARDGGSGQNGNGINVYRAGNVTIANNRVTDCAYSAIRNNSGANCLITGNSISRTDEVAIYVEFAFEGAVVSNNMINDVAFGISITNLDQGGRLAVVSGNVVRDCKGGRTEGVKTGGGIYAEADTAVTGNVIENARDVGLALGWGQYCRNLIASGNLIRNCGKGITVSLADGAEAVLIASNRISGSKRAAIMGMKHLEEATGDLAKPGAEVPETVRLEGNLVS